MESFKKSLAYNLHNCRRPQKNPNHVNMNCPSVMSTFQNSEKKLKLYPCRVQLFFLFSSPLRTIDKTLVEGGGEAFCTGQFIIFL